MDEMNAEPVDLGHEVRQGHQLSLARAPVVVRGPVTRQLLNRFQLHALRMIGDGFHVGPARCLYALAQALAFSLRRDRDRERPDFSRDRHSGLLGLKTESPRALPLSASGAS